MFEGLSFTMQGVITALTGLGGTFAVLVLIYVGIKLMQKIGSKKTGEDK